MDDQPEPGAKYRAATYEAEDDAPWYHFLHGNVPGHQIDYIYQAKVPQGALERQHFSHLTRLLRFIEPQSTGEIAFAIGNLSRDDIRHEPGHGGLALILGLRIHGVVDHAGRQDPPFAHAIAAVDRALDYGALLETALQFHKRVLARSADWYREYVRLKTEEPETAARAIERYVARFEDLPSPAASGLSQAWTIGPAPPPKRIVIAHDEEADFGEIAYTAARIAAVLYPSDIKWTSISNGRDRESDEPGKVTIRFLARSQIGPNETVVYDIEDLPEEEADLAAKLFKAESTAESRSPNAFPRRLSRVEPAEPARRSWEGAAPAPAPRAARSSEPGGVDVDVSMDEPPETATLPLSVRPPRTVPSQRPPAPSEPPEGDRAAMVEMMAVPIPPAAPVPAEASSRAGSPAPTPAPSPSPPASAVAPVPATAVVKAAAAGAPAPEGAPSTRTFWLIVGGFVVTAGVVLGILALQSAPPPVQLPPPVQSAPPPTATTPSVAPSPTPTPSMAPSPAPTSPPVATVVPEPAETTAPESQPSAVESAKKPGKRPKKSSLLDKELP